jgi:hypothetical protein
MNEAVITRPQRITSMKAAMEELGRACALMRDALRESNDERYQAFFNPVLDRIGMIVANEREGIALVLADDLTNVRSAVRRMRLPDIDPDLDSPTPALKALRGGRGNLIEAIDNALDAAAFLRMHPRFSEFGGIYIERAEIAEQLIRLDERLRVVQDAVVDLRSAAITADAAAGAHLVNQSDLVNVHVKTLTVEVSGARFETRVGNDASIPHDSDISALTRSIEAMNDIAADLKQAVEGLGGMMAAAVPAKGMIVVSTVEQSRRGSKTVVSAVRRKLQSSLAAQPDGRRQAPRGFAPEPTRPIAPMRSAKGLKGFISYASADRYLCEMFRRQLLPLELNGIAAFWADHGIEPGDPWKDAILSQLEQAEVVLVLISPDLFWSDFIRQIEWPLMRKRMKAGHLLVIPVILRDTALWERIFDGELGRLQAVPRGAKPIAESPSRDAAFAEAARMITDRIERGAPRA